MRNMLIVGSVDNNQLQFSNLSTVSYSDFKGQQGISSPAATNQFRIINMQLMRIFKQLFVNTIQDASVVNVDNVLFMLRVK